MAGGNDEMLSIPVLINANPVQSILPFIGVLTEYAEEFNTVLQQFTQKPIVPL